jgi:hypothetical protein
VPGHGYSSGKAVPFLATSDPACCIIHKPGVRRKTGRGGFPVFLLPGGFSEKKKRWHGMDKMRTRNFSLKRIDREFQVLMFYLLFRNPAYFSLNNRPE